MDCNLLLNEAVHELKYRPLELEIKQVISLCDREN